MKKLSEEQIKNYCKQINGSHEHLYKIKARVEYPLGEITNLAGFWWVKKMKGEEPNIQPITKYDTFDAQGLEGKIVEEVNIVDACIRWNFCRPNRCQIFT